MINEDIWAKDQYQVLAGFVHHLAYYRILSDAYTDISRKSEFWTRTIDAHLLRAVTDWCMIFGADSNEIHWKKVVSDESTKASFRQHLMTVTGMSSAQWDSYWLSVTSFRNEYAVHRNNQDKHHAVPMMDMALKIAVSYDDWLRDVMQADFEEPSLRDRYQRLIRTSKQTLAGVVCKGPWLEDEYEGSPPTE
jgi:hypothetical protein